MSDEFTHDVEFEVPDRLWDVVRKCIRELREHHRAGGGTSKVVKHGEQVSITLTGPVSCVLTSVQVLEGLRSALAKSKVQHKVAGDALLAGIKAHQAQREQAAAEMLLDAILKGGGRR